MTKKFENFGTALSREQMKKIMGGCGIGELCDDGGLSCEDECVRDSDCAGQPNNKCKNVACGQTQCVWECSY
ncbi:MAG: hypothetical protein IT251_08110 [Chitinophagaceae bacterium]|nr:hypothetical protein [Chitinophagaceae bacterium]MCC6635452.1 hypothetical protein [Chitinophagaceae bacterium]